MEPAVKTYLGIFFILGALTVILGAFGAHALENKLSPKSLDIWNKGVFYQFIHVIIAIVVLNLSKQAWTTTSALFFLIGIICFSGSLYILAFKESLQMGKFLKVVGPITPIGGLFFILGWIYSAIKIFGSK